MPNKKELKHKTGEFIDPGNTFKSKVNYLRWQTLDGNCYKLKCKML